MLRGIFFAALDFFACQVAVGHGITADNANRDLAIAMPCTSADHKVLRSGRR